MASRDKMMNMKTKNIFLSASVPLKERDPQFYETADVIAIRDSVIALASTVLSNEEYRLVWGGHPSITPLISLVLDRYNLKMSSRVILYQSMEFEKFFPPQNEDVGERIYTDKKSNRAESLQEMRRRMIGENHFVAAFFIGGMEGVLDEYKTFKEFHKNVPCYPLASTGAAAEILFKEQEDEFDIKLKEELSYTFLFKDLLNL